MQNSIDAITNTQIVLKRLNVNVRRAFENCFANDLVNEFDHGSLGIVGVQFNRNFSFLKHFKRAVAFQDFVKCFCTDAVERFHCAQKLRARH